MPQRYDRSPRTYTTVPGPDPHKPLGTTAETVLAGSDAEPTRVDPGPRTLDRGDGADGRYDVRRKLGEGGMGEVHLCRDRRIGRDVARKSLRREREGRADLKARFLREARVQGQLEHPAVVPVYDLGVSPDGETFFTMKRIRGQTLEEVLGDLADGVPETTARWSRRKLLSAFSQVCLAVDFAHQRGVLHRDLKPGNIMLGDFGEVYVLDWGLARIAEHADLVTLDEGLPAPGAPDAPATIPSSDTSDAPETIDGARPSHPSHTVAGAIMGTPGYMAPEQARGETDAFGPATDVYALGAILYELLAGEPLHHGASPVALIASTLRPVDARPSRRLPDANIAPELDAACARATALAAADRHPSARALHDEIERFLDGDRDLARRRELAEGHTRAAEEAAARALEAARPVDERESERRRALREVGRALALEPDSAVAVRTLVQLLTQPPAEPPRAAVDELNRSLGATVSFSHRLCGWAYLAWLPFLPMLLFMGVRNWTTFILSWPLVVVIGVLHLYAARVHGRNPARDLRLNYVILALNTMVMLFGTRMFGPFILIPGIAAMTSLAVAIHPNRLLRGIGIAAGCSAILAPAALEWIGMLDPSYRFSEGLFSTVSHGLAFPPVLTNLFLLFNSLAVVVTSAFYIGFVRDALIGAERRHIVQAWQLKQLVPEQAVAPQGTPLVMCDAEGKACGVTAKAVGG